MEMQVPVFDNVLATPGHLIGLAARGFARLAEERLKPHGFAVGQLPVLVALEKGIANTQRDLAQFAATRQPPMAQMLARMARDGLIKSHPDPQDGRVTRIVLTESARQQMPDALGTLFAGNRQAMRGFSEAEVALFVEMLQRLIVNLNEIDPAPARPGKIEDTGNG